MVWNVYTINQESLHSQFSSAIGTERCFCSRTPDEVVGLHLEAMLQEKICFCFLPSAYSGVNASQASVADSNPACIFTLASSVSSGFTCQPV